MGFKGTFCYAEQQSQGNNIEPMISIEAVDWKIEVQNTISADIN